MRKLARSILATGAATVTDLATLTFLVSGLRFSPRVASVPALLLAGVVSFITNRTFAFRVRGADGMPRQAALFAALQSTTIALNAVAFDALMHVRGAPQHYWLVRLAVSNLVYLTWSFPMMNRVFTRGEVRLTDRNGA